MRKKVVGPSALRDPWPHWLFEAPATPGFPKQLQKGQGSRRAEGPTTFSSHLPRNSVPCFTWLQSRNLKALRARPPPLLQVIFFEQSAVLFENTVSSMCLSSFPSIQSPKRVFIESIVSCTCLSRLPSIHLQYSSDHSAVPYLTTFT